MMGSPGFYSDTPTTLNHCPNSWGHYTQRVFENPKYDAVLLLPPAGKEAFARPEHLMTLR
jgi:hypothetical protein